MNSKIQDTRSYLYQKTQKKGRTCKGAAFAFRWEGVWLFIQRGSPILDTKLRQGEKLREEIRVSSVTQCLRGEMHSESFIFRT